ncbi:MAG TPA: GAF domain-containing protein [Anaerolineae bacterium]|nr:GAF domain-containing protein [Anaerolineae bacterium]
MIGVGMEQVKTKPKVLSIDDTPSSRRLVQRLLSAHYEVFEASDGLTGIDEALQVEPALILVDLNLPQFTGYEVATRLKALMPDVPIVALSADMSDHVHERVLASGCDGYIPKPIDPDTFEEQVANFLGGQREELLDDSYRDAYQQTLVARLEQKVRELTEALKSNADLNEQHAQLLKETQRRAILLAAGAKVAQSITSILDLDELLQATVKIIGEEFGFYYVGVFLVEPGTDWLVLRAGLGEAGAAMVAADHRLKIGGLSMVGAATSRRKAISARDVGVAPVHFKNPHLPLTRSEMALPLILGNEIIGALTVQSVEENAFSQDDVKALQTMADQLAVAIRNATTYLENTRLLANAERRTRLLEAAAEVGRRVTSILDTDTLLKETVDILCDAYGFYYAGVFLVDPTLERKGPDGELEQWAVLRAGRGDAGRLMIAAGHKLKVGGLSMIGTAIASRKALIALDVGEEPVHFKNPHLPLTRSEMALPLGVGDRVIGAVTVQSAAEAAFTPEDITILQSMVDQLAIAIANARLLKDLESAHSELVRTKTFEAIATATGEAIHWVGNKAAPIPASAGRVAEDVTRYFLMMDGVLKLAPPELQEHKFSQMLRAAVEYIEEYASETNFALDVVELRAQLEQRSLRQLSRALSAESIFEDLEIARQSSRSILNIKEDLIGPAREKHLEAVNLEQFLRTIVKSMGIPEGVARYLFSENMAQAKADIRQLENVFNNLLKNAMEAMDKVEDKKLFIWGRRADDPRFVVVDITDNGEGIPSEIIDKIWVPFYTTKGNRGGTGLGLPACNKIITQLGGKLTLDSMVGEGTTFSVYLPIYKE